MMRAEAEQIGECQERTADLSEEPTKRDQLFATQYRLRYRLVDLMQSVHCTIELVDWIAGKRQRHRQGGAPPSTG